MPAVVRVKRRIDEEPLGAFVLNGKRRRLDNENAGAEVADGEEMFGATCGTKNNGEVSTVLKLAGTIDNQDDIATTKFVRLTKEEALSRLTKEEAEELVKFRRSQPKTSDLLRRKREEKRQLSHENRFRVVNCLRKPFLENANEGEDFDNNAAEASAVPKLTIVDIEKQPITQEDDDKPSTSFAASSAAATASLFTGPPNRGAHVVTNTNVYHNEIAHPIPPSDSDIGYVYDLYLADEEEEEDYTDLDDNRLSAFPYYEEAYDCDNDEDFLDDEEDSNDENYYTNDYPDEESEYTNYRVRKALERLNSTYREEYYTDLSSEDEFDDFFYCGPNDSTDSDDDYYQVASDKETPDIDFIHTLNIDECTDKDIDMCAADESETGNSNDDDYV